MNKRKGGAEKERIRNKAHLAKNEAIKCRKLSNMFASYSNASHIVRMANVAGTEIIFLSQSCLRYVIVI